MTTLTKRRKYDRVSPSDIRLVTPWTSGFLRPWNDRFFNTTFNDLNDLIKIDDAFKDDFFEENSLMPAMNIKENENDFEIEFAAPGFEKNDFKITIEDEILHVSGKKEQQDESKDDNYSRKEFSYQSFKRSMMLPSSLDLKQDINASYKHGILTIKLLKNEATKTETTTKSIEVK